jgi:hypothetical protein
MRRASGYRKVFVVLAFLGCSGCHESAFPLDIALQAEVEPALIGVWRCLPFDDTASEQASTLTIAPGRRAPVRSDAARGWRFR